MSDEYIKVAEINELTDDEGKCVVVGETQIALFKSSDDEVHAIGNVCPHQGAPLADGYFDDEDCIVTCPLHSWDFDVRTGKRVNGIESVTPYKTRIVDNAVEVCLD